MKILMKAALLTAAAAGALSACGGGVSAVSGSGISSTPPTTTAATPAADPTSSAPAPSTTGPIGTSFTDTDSSGNVVIVQLVKVIDPAQGVDSYTTPDNGKRFVGAEFTLTGKSGTFSGDANNDTTLITSDGQTQQPDFNDLAGCTNFNSGSFNLQPGQSSTGCVAFQVPTGLTVKSVQWNEMFSSGAPATWTIG